jgi:hypothetical protein
MNDHDRQCSAEGGLCPCPASPPAQSPGFRLLCSRPSQHPGPRPSNVLQAEIDSRMPNALACLRLELEVGLEQEAQSNCSDGACDL